MELEIPARVRSLFVSDLHLGTRNAKAGYLSRLLAEVEMERLILVGDVFDLWKLEKGIHWPEAHGRLIREIIELARQGTEVILVPGNHDAALRRFSGLTICGIRIHRQWTCELADGRRLLVMHGDEMDPLVRRSRIKAWLGDTVYDVLLLLDRFWDHCQARLGHPQYRSLAAALKAQSKEAEAAIRVFSEGAAAYARESGHDGVVCGHIHRADLREIEGTIYANCGDWVESNSALVEGPTGALSLLRYDARLRPAARSAAPARTQPLPDLEEVLAAL